MNKFERISQKQFEEDFGEPYPPVSYNDIVLPRRVTERSAGYDIFSPMNVMLSPGESVKIPTGIRVILDSNKFFAIVPRSSLGFKYRLQLDNTIGIVDADYSGADNEGHIWIKLTNDSKENKTVFISKGMALAQGIICSYAITDDDDAAGIRRGGIGSTSESALT
ncbi:MAG: deoxyuridine 5'-triphosphate nucleotidohydrolase [Eubacteriales bacterium]